MILDLKLDILNNLENSGKLKYMYCLEKCIAVAANLLNKNYDMMYCKMWGFKFNNQQDGLQNLGKRISANFVESDMYSLLEKYHGISLNRKKADSIEDFFEIIGKELERGLPIAIGVNEFFLPWINFNKHAAGLILILGYDEVNIYCLDIHNYTRALQYKGIKSIPKAAFINDNISTKEVSYYVFEEIPGE